MVDVAGKVGEVGDSIVDTGQFDLAKENIHGMFSNLTLLTLVLASVSKDIRNIREKLTFKREYDYIIVGGGTAGSVMASRLSEKPCVSVLLLEAGGHPPILTEVPSFARVFYGSPVDWAYKTTPQKYAAFGQKENRVIWNSGKGLGGSSMINAMLYVRGNKKNFDDWAAEGATGWSYNDVEKHFLKLEDNRDIEELDPGFHRSGGPMTAEKIKYNPEIKNPLLNAMIDMGYEVVDSNGKRQTGIYDLQATVRNQQRCHTAKAYLGPARNRRNLDILTHAFVRRILFRGKVASGIQFEYRGRIRSVRARQEVIVSNGAIRTPQLLMLSGIGPKDHLEQLQIPVVADLPVGKNLQDHCATNLVYTLKKTITPVLAKNIWRLNVENYIVNRKGPLTAPNQVTLLAFLNGLNTTANSTDFPRQEIYFAEYTEFDAKLNLNLKDEVYSKVYAPYALQPLMICFSSLLQPYSRGEITLKSKNPHDYPLINPNYYEDERDLKDVVEGMKICNAVADHPAMKEVEAKLIDTQKSNFPKCEGLEGNEDEYFGCIAKQVVNTFWHSAGTARMGSRNDSRSVVDPELRVIGVERLRVVNAAVMPKVTSGNTNVPTMMIAEKAYDMMKDDITCGRNDQCREGPTRTRPTM